MLSGTIFRASAIVGTAVLRIVVSSDSMKNATATSHGRRRFRDSFGKGFRSCNWAPRKGTWTGYGNPVQLIRLGRVPSRGAPECPAPGQLKSACVGPPA